MIGININCKERDFVALILSGEKTYETRRTPSLRPYVGKRVGIIRTGRGKATLCGYATITEEELKRGWIRYLETESAKIRGTSYENNNWYYRLSNVEQCEPVPVTSRGIVARAI